MNDDDLRQRFDLLTSRVDAKPGAEGWVRARAGRIRQRRRIVAATGVTVVLLAAVIVPEALANQDSGSSATPGASGSAPPALTTTCSPTLSRVAASYGVPQHEYGLRTSGQAAAGFVRGLHVAPGSTIDFCLVVGSLDNLAASTPEGSAPKQMHYALLADPGGAPRLVYAAMDLPAAPMPGVSSSAIAAYSAAAQPSGPATQRPCTSGDLLGQLSNMGLPDGLVQGDVTIVNTSATPCTLDASLTRMVPLTSTGQPLPVPSGEQPGLANGVGEPKPVNEVLPPTKLVSGLVPASAQGAVVLTVGGDPSAGSCVAADRSTRPAAFRFTIGALSVTVANHDPHAQNAAATAVYGCPSRFYVGSLNGQ